MTMAVALNTTPHPVGVVTDDGAALKLLATEEGASFTTSLTLLRRWSEVAELTAPALSEALNNLKCV
ncbi:hypothetical protein [Deinococcus peraridilitoris]|uniref:Uncharacterized protein n=1 Tax=Deinococcus peraridilitoris (strain DSM 19664 / LMG 22246 / CIP 109416 / KR-200) TaxID=937777 RepID=K9ZZW9_DEIPD|nr:hypothetical protein [Deinococcus peraridilitoris]AFZ67173.1 hypothetical protein Deipe_1639 [Deinococcus peraridilitoris DSM 19664]